MVFFCVSYLAFLNFHTILYPSIVKEGRVMYVIAKSFIQVYTEFCWLTINFQCSDGKNISFGVCFVLVSHFKNMVSSFFK